MVHYLRQGSTSELETQLASILARLTDLEELIPSDPGEDRLLGWKESVNELRYYGIGSGLVLASDYLTTSGGGGSTNSADYASRAEAILSAIPVPLTYVRTAGYTTAADGGGALYKKVVAEPSHEGKIQSADGAWWEISEPVVSPKMFGAVPDGSTSTRTGTDDTPAIQATFDFAATRARCFVKFEPGCIYALATTVDIPTDRNVIVDAHGAVFVSLTTDLVFFSRMPVDQTAAVIAIAYKVLWYGGEIWGRSNVLGGDQIGLQIGATYQSIIEGLYGQNLGAVIDVQFGLQTIIRGCMGVNCRGDVFRVRNGQWSGAGITNAQSNSSVVQSCRVFALAGAPSSFLLEGTSGCSLKDCIVEGGNPVNNVRIDGLGSTVAKGVMVDGLHSENVPTNAVILAVLAGGDLIVDRVFAQSSVTLVDNTGSAAATQIWVRNIPWMSSGHRFKHETGSPTLWMFGNVTLNPTDSAIWIATTGYSFPGVNRVMWAGIVDASGYHISASGGQIKLRDTVYFPTGADIGATSSNRPDKAHIATAVTIAGGTELRGHLSATATRDFPSIPAAETSAALTITVTGAATGDQCLASPSGIEAGLTWSAWVSATNTVSIVLHNGTASPIDPASRTWRATVFKSA